MLVYLDTLKTFSCVEISLMIKIRPSSLRLVLKRVEEQIVSLLYVNSFVSGSCKKLEGIQMQLFGAFNPFALSLHSQNALQFP